MATKEEVAQFLGMTERNLANIIKKYPGAPVAHGKGQWDTQAMVQWYINILKNEAKTAKKPADSTAASEEDEQDIEKAFAKRKRALELEKLESDVLAKQIKNKRDMGEWGPIAMLEHATEKLAANLSSRFDGFIPRLKLKCPDITPEMMAAMEIEVVAFQNECANSVIDFSDYETDLSDEDED